MTASPQPQLVGLRNRHSAVHERRRERPDEDEQQEHGRKPQPDPDDREHEDRERRVEHEQAPRLLVEVAHRSSQGRADAHPFTPAAVTPAMKYRWAATKSNAIGMIEITLAAISCGQSVLYCPMKLESPTVSE